jgi:hypothetical protein
VFRDEFEDTDNFRFGVIALTILTANTRTGQIYDADIERVRSIVWGSARSDG